MKEIRLGIIGIGGMGSGHALSIAEGKVPGIRLSAVADIRKERLKWAEKELPAGIKTYSDGREMIDSGECDAVLIATPHYYHPEFVIYALEHGLHALSEKPAGVYTKQVRRMNEAAEKSDKVFAIMFNQRTNCVYRKLHEMIESGAIISPPLHIRNDLNGTWDAGTLGRFRMSEATNERVRAMQ